MEEKQVASANKGKNVSELVDKKLVEILMGCGFPKVVCEKALYLTDNDSEDKAMDWIEKHQQDSDFDDELFIIEYSFHKTHRKEEQVLSEADERRRIRALLKETRHEMKEKEKEGEEKVAAPASSKATNTKEQGEKQDKNSKEQKEQENNVKEQSRKDERMEKITIPVSKPAETRNTRLQKAKRGINLINEKYPEHKHPGVAKTCLKTLRTCLSNLINEPENDKFKKINKENKNFQERVGQIQGSMYFLEAVGFESDENFLVIKKVNKDLIDSVIALLNDALP